jgi:hypothetical protein
MAELAETRTWITGEEFNRERRRLIAEGVAARAPEMEALRARMAERNDYIWETHGLLLMSQHPGKWAAITVDGSFLLADSEYEAMRAARERFGAGSCCIARLTPDRGIPRLGPRS